MPLFFLLSSSPSSFCHPRLLPSVILAFFLLSSSPSSFCHPRRLSPTPVPDLIGDPIKGWIQSSRGSSVFGLCLFPSSPRHHMAPPQGACGRGCAPVPKLRKHSSPRRAGPKPRTHLSPSVIPDLIRDPAFLYLHSPLLSSSRTRGSSAFSLFLFCVVAAASSLVKARDMPHDAVFPSPQGGRGRG